MKKIPLTGFIIFIILKPLYSNDAEHDFNIKVGINVPVIMEDKSPKKASMDTIFGFNIGIVKYFALGFETGLNWVSWESYTGSQRESGIVTNVHKKETNALTLPLIVNFMIRFDKRDVWKIMPYILPGIGYGFTFFIHPDSQETYHGYTWQIITGLSIKIGEVRNIEILIEFGYRGAQYKDRNDYELDMSGMLFHAGIRLPFEINDF